MRKQSPRRSRQFGGAIASAALALSLLLPAAASAQVPYLDVGQINLQRDCGTANAGDNNAQGAVQLQHSTALGQPEHLGRRAQQEQLRAGSA